MKKRIPIILIALSLLTFPNISFGQAPNLGTASSFALFTAVGALTNVGSSTVIGDLGTNAGAFSGFNTATVMGNTHVADPTSASAAVDVVNAYNSMVAASCDRIIAAGLAGQTLTPGVSCQITPAVSTLNGTLTLDGQGDPNAVFVIKLGSALVTGTNSSVVLTNGASAKNVFFQILGAATLNTGTTFRGTIVAMGAIVLNSTTLEGRALSTVGAITVNESRITIPVVTVSIPDLRPIIYAVPTAAYGTTDVTVVVDVVELLSMPSSGLITVKVTRDSKVNLTMPTSATSVGARSVQNSVWTFTPDPSYYVLTTTQVIAAGDKLSFGLTGSLTPGATQGSLSISSTIVGGSGGEVKTDNNVDVDRIDHFQQ